MFLVSSFCYVLFAVENYVMCELCWGWSPRPIALVTWQCGMIFLFPRMRKLRYPFELVGTESSSSCMFLPWLMTVRPWMMTTSGLAKVCTTEIGIVEGGLSEAFRPHGRLAYAFT